MSMNEVRNSLTALNEVRNSGMRQVVKPEQIPKTPHFAALVYRHTIRHVEGDERSRTNPGHGYPAHDVESDDVEHWVTEDRAALASFVYKLQKDDSKARVAFFKVEKIGELKVSVDVDVSL